MRRLAAALAARVPARVQRLAGTVLGAVPLATAVSLETGLPMVIVRTETKEYGTSKQVEGTLEAGERVLLLEDVVTTGGAALAAVDVLTNLGVEVIGVVSVVDREEGGAAAFAARGVPFESLFTKTTLRL